MSLRKRLALLLAGTLSAGLVLVSLRAAPETARLDPEKIAQAAGTKTTVAPDGVVRIAWARTEASTGVALPRFQPGAAARRRRRDARYWRRGRSCCRTSGR